MSSFNKTLAMCLAVLTPPAALAQTEVETFDGGQFNNPVFNFVFEFPEPNWEFAAIPQTQDVSLHLTPNFTNVTFNLRPGQIVESMRVDIYDGEGGYANSPTSAVIARSETGFLVRNASELFTLETIEVSMDDLDNSDSPLGPITQIDLQASNEFIGGFFDDLGITIAAAPCFADFDGDGRLTVLDFIAFQTAFSRGDDSADCNGDRALDVLDFVCFQAAFAAGCG